MDVDEILNNDLEALTRRASITDKEAHLQRIFVALNADDTEQDSDATGLITNSLTAGNWQRKEMQRAPAELRSYSN